MYLRLALFGAAVVSSVGCTQTEHYTPIDLGPRAPTTPASNDLGAVPNMIPLFDLSTPGSGDDSGSGNSGSDDLASPAKGCTAYTMSSIATMRQGNKGCFELDNVVTLAVTPVSPNGKSVTIVVQDSMGGDYSAIKLGCSTTSSHPCTVFSAAKGIFAGRAVTAQGYYDKAPATAGGFEEFFIDSISDVAAGTAPAPATLVEADIERSTTMSSTNKPMAAYWFQAVSVNVSDKLVMFDWSPPEFMRSSTSTSCQQYFAFGMIPTSAAATATVGAACNGTTQPAGQTTVNAKEVLVSTDYYSGFTFSTNCACKTMYPKDPIPTATQGVTGPITALLDYDVPAHANTGYQYIAPLTNANFPIK